MAEIKQWPLKWCDAIQGWKPGCIHPPGERELIHGMIGYSICCKKCGKDITEELRSGSWKESDGK
jgi:hypothetical protein